MYISWYVSHDFLQFSHIGLLGLAKLDTRGKTGNFTFAISKPAFGEEVLYCVKQRLTMKVLYYESAYINAITL